jgi:hypothetical protein
MDQTAPSFPVGKHSSCEIATPGHAALGEETPSLDLTHVIITGYALVVIPPRPWFGYCCTRF